MSLMMGERGSVPNETLRDLIGTWRFSACGDTGVLSDRNCHSTCRARHCAGVVSRQKTAYYLPTALVPGRPRMEVLEARTMGQEALKPVDGNENVQSSAPADTGPPEYTGRSNPLGQWDVPAPRAHPLGILTGPAKTPKIVLHCSIPSQQQGCGTPQRTGRRNDLPGLCGGEKKLLLIAVQGCRRLFGTHGRRGPCCSQMGEVQASASSVRRATI
ncbi:hypothetical protein FKM82_023009 [Ascaphus truei]